MNPFRLAIIIAGIILFHTPKLYSQGNTLTFDGTNDYVQLPGPFTIGTNNFTFEVWVKPATTAMGMVFAQDVGGDVNDQFRLHTINTTADFALSGAGGSPFVQVTTPAGTVPTNEWSHIAIIRNAGTVTIYINGISSAAGSTAVINNQGGSDPSKPFRIGARGGTAHTSGQNNFNGSIDELKYWNVARTAAQIKTNLFNAPPANAGGLVAMYKFDEGSGSSLINSCTNTPGINGVLTNGPVWEGSPIAYSENAIDLDGANDMVAVGAPNPTNSSFTREAWVNIPTHAGNLNIISSSSSPFWIAGGHLNAGIANNYNLVADPVSFPLNTWVHVAVTFDDAANTMRLYRDGNIVATNTGVASSYTSENTFIGSHAGTQSFFRGSIDDVRFWNVARSQAEIQNNRSTELNAANEPDLAAYYTFNQGIITGNNSGLRVVPDQKGDFNGVMNNFTLNGSFSNYITQNTGLITLPLLWKEFTASLRDGDVLVQWSTEQEQNTSYFAVQHHKQGGDWQNISSMAAAGNSTTPQYYQHTHQAPPAGINYYRILQKDLDGQQSYSEVRRVMVVEKMSQSFIVKSNPVINGIIQVQVTSAVTLSLFTADGKLLFKKQVAPGAHQIPVPALSKGLYMLKAGNASEKIMVQ